MKRKSVTEFCSVEQKKGGSCRIERIERNEVDLKLVRHKACRTANNCWQMIPPGLFESKSRQAIPLPVSIHHSVLNNDEWTVVSLKFNLLQSLLMARGA